MSDLYLITGGAGFIGSHIVDELVRRNFRVRVLDDMTSGKNKLPTNVETIQASMSDHRKVEAACEGVSGIFHCAALPHLQWSIDHPLQTHEVNLTGTLNIILAARKQKVKRVIFSSSAAVYGNQKTPFRESMSCEPISPYGVQKLASEHYLRIAPQLWGVENVILRYASVYGPRMSINPASASVIALFLMQQRDKEPLTVTSDGAQTRDFIYVSDVVSANIRALESQHLGKAEIFNIGTGIGISILNVAQEIGGQIEYIGARTEVHDAAMDISAATQSLNWKPEVSFSEGIRTTKEWFHAL